jgi:signal peptidase II
MTRRRREAGIFWSVGLTVVILDAATKLLAVAFLSPQRMQHAVIGDALRWTLVYNPGAAFGLHLGEHSRWIFTLLTLGALAILWRLYTHSRAGDRLRALAIALVAGGAVGNLVDRLRSPLGVVDFIDAGLGDARWPTFNVADMAVSTGAFLLAWVLWGEESVPVVEATRATDS